MREYPVGGIRMRCSVRPVQRVFAAIARRVMGTITHVSTQDAVAALTFDDGPHPEFTPRLLDILERHQAHATFFMVGKSAQQHPDLVRRIAQAGHAIGNHTWDHSSFSLISRRERRAQLRACEKAIAPYGQRLFRPPYGQQSVASRLDALWLGYQVVTWNVSAGDCRGRDANWMIDRVAKQIKPGSVILFHDVLYHIIEERCADREPMFEVVNMLLEQFSDCFRFITVPELFQHGRPQRRNWYWKADADWLNSLKARQGEPRHYSNGSGRK
jgi:peptidoglycan/xylan/chitin deacetylase (PgdA/CDA1 family)